MGTYIRYIILAIMVFSLAYAHCTADYVAAGKPTLEERQQRIESLMKGLEEQMKTPNTPNRVKVKEHWKFRCIIGNGLDYPVWVQLWDGEEIIFSEVIPAREDRVLWLGDDRSRILYLVQWKKVGHPGHLYWKQKGWILDSKAAFVADEMLQILVLEEEDDS
jgi:hypothetical protein